MEFDIQFEIGSTVYLKTDTEQFERIVTGLMIRPKGLVSYLLSFGSNESTHFAFEITKERDILKVTTN